MKWSEDWIKTAREIVEVEYQDQYAGRFNADADAADEDEDDPLDPWEDEEDGTAPVSSRASSQGGGGDDDNDNDDLDIESEPEIVRPRHSECMRIGRHVLTDVVGRRREHFRPLRCHKAVVRRQNQR